MEGEPVAEFWGCTFDGCSGKVRPNYKRAVPLGVGFLGSAIGDRGAGQLMDLLDSIVGGLVSCFQYRRRCLSILQNVYTEVRPKDRSELFTLSAKVRGELLAAVALLPQCDIDLSARAAPLVLDTDASNEAEAGLHASCPKKPRPSSIGTPCPKGFGINCWIAA